MAIRNTARESLLRKVQTYAFTLDELTLYLDTHKTCRHGLSYFRKYRELYDTAVAEYTERYGPLSVTEAKAEDCWDWTNAPWPWESED